MTLFATGGPAPADDSVHLGAPYQGVERRRRITVLLVTSQLSLGDAFRPTLERYRAVKFVCALTVSTPDILEAIERRAPRILLLDEHLLAALSPTDIASISSAHPRLRVLLISDRDDPDVLDLIVRNRFHGLLKSTVPADLCVKALFKVNRGEHWLPRNLMERALFAPKSATNRLGPAIERKLSKREAETVRHLCSGMTNRQIAEALGIREDTVKKHLHKAYAKLGVKNRTQLIAEATQHVTSDD